MSLTIGIFSQPFSSYPLTTYPAFNALRKGIAKEWLLREDVVKLFGDRRQNLRFVCTFNLAQDLLFYSDESGHIQIPLARLRMPASDPVR